MMKLSLSFSLYLGNVLTLLILLPTHVLAEDASLIPGVCRGKFDSPPQEFKIQPEFEALDQGPFGTCYGAASTYLIKHYYLATKSSQDPDIDQIALMDVLGAGTCGRYPEGGFPSAVLYNIKKRGAKIAYESGSNEDNYPIDYTKFFTHRREMKGESCVRTLTKNVLDTETLKVLEEPLKAFDPRAPEAVYRLIDQHPAIKKVKLKPFNIYQVSAKDKARFWTAIHQSLTQMPAHPVVLTYCSDSVSNECMSRHAISLAGFRNVCCDGKCYDELLVKNSNLGESGWMMANPLIETSNRYGGEITYLKQCRDLDPSQGKSVLEECRNWPQGDFSLHTLARAGDLQEVKNFLNRIPAQGRRKALNRKDPAGLNVLNAAVASHNVDLVRFLLNQKIDIHALNRAGRTILFDAILENHLALVQMLLELGADVNQVDQKGVSPLMAASQVASASIVRLLIAKGAKVSGQSEKGETPLHYAVDKNRSKIVKILLKNKASKTQVNNKGYSSVHRFSQNNGSDRVYQLLMSKDTINRPAQDGETPLHLAVKNGHLDLVEKLIRDGADVNQPNLLGGPPICYALVKKDLNLIEVLSKNKAKLNVSCGNETLLGMAVEIGKEYVRNLLDHGADINYPNTQGVTPLGVAARISKNGDLDLIRFLMDRGAEINPVTSTGQTPLLQATLSDNGQVVSYLLKQGAEIDHAELDGGDTALCLAVYHGHYGSYRELVRRGADVNKTCDGETPVCLATLSHWEFIADLVKNGAWVDKPCGSGVSPLSIAASEGEDGVTDALLRLGASLKNLVAGPTPEEKQNLFNSVTTLRKIYSSPAMEEDLQAKLILASMSMHGVGGPPDLNQSFELLKKIDSKKIASKQPLQVNTPDVNTPNINTIDAWTELSHLYENQGNTKLAKACLEQASRRSKN